MTCEIGSGVSAANHQPSDDLMTWLGKMTGDRQGAQPGPTTRAVFSFGSRNDITAGLLVAAKALRAILQRLQLFVGVL